MRTDSKEKISVIVPVYNVEKYLKECLDSLIGQTFKEFEIICIDDGSTDESTFILEEYKNKDERIKVYHQKNRGLGNARNVGVQYASGKYIYFLDSDDKLKPTALEKLYEEAIAADVDVVIFNTEVFYEDEDLEIKQNQNNYYKRERTENGVYDGRELFIHLRNSREYIHSAWLLFIKKEWLEKENIYFLEGIYYEDVLFTLNIFLKAKSIKYLSDKLHMYRVRYNSIINVQFHKEKCIHSLISYLTVYKEFQAQIYREYDFDVKNTLMDIGREILASIRKMDFVVRKKGHKIDISDYSMRYLAEELGLGSFGEKGFYDDELYLEGFNSTIRQANNIILYGAGDIGKKTLRYLKRCRWAEKVVAFAVTDAVDEERQIDGIPVKNINELLDNYESDLIILSANYIHHEKMRQMLSGYSKEYIVAVDVNLEQMIMDEI